ncbi:MAG: hypothetical protein APR54_02815 [Candidatus Cloacimonas sp. SDB]|nr:MAG: hypothetical protein APR54_02815 [Candidatus Cloacimonas sp. SDB]
MEFNEQFLYHIWDAQHLVNDLETISGKELEIMYSGRWNTDSGPDFKEAIIRIGDKVKRGDIEIHLRSYDWDIHNHSENKDFNRTILHVVYKHDQPYNFTIKEDGEKLEILEIENLLNEDISKLISKYETIEFEHKDKHCDFFGGLSTESLNYLLVSSGLQRLEKKIRRFNTELYFSDYNQLLYQGIMESLGYSKNKFQLLHLALQLPYARLKEYQYLGMTRDELLALMLCSTDLINHLPASISQELKHKYNSLFLRSGFQNMRFPIDWKLFRLRPINHPAVRILQIADFIYQSLDNTFFYKIIQLFSFPRGSFNIGKFRKKFYALFNSSDQELPDNLKLGLKRKDIMMINVILPLAILYARNMSFEDFETTALEVYKNYGGLAENYIIRNLAKFMTANQRKLISKKAIYQQGLLDIYYDYCINHSCAGCKARRDEMLGEMQG